MATLANDDQPIGLMDRWTDDEHPRTLYLARRETYLEEDKYELLDGEWVKILEVNKCQPEGNMYTDDMGSQWVHTSTGLFTRKSVVKLESNPTKEVGWAELDFQGGCRYILRFLDTYTGQVKIMGTKGTWNNRVELLVDDRVIAIVHKGEQRQSESNDQNHQSDLEEESGDRIYKSCFQRKIELKANVDPALVFVAIVLFEQMGGNREFSPEGADMRTLA